ncbi:NAD(P)H-dependent flavin oxidoreductase [Aliibacillus thermotolerans]|uniref:Probable nitronate monooxygenase n=1 Tax=Aliibacillus thermotolerans TaxID=1834418 RepID=A0ABW0U8D9_9BACI|nr:nitronate monooxygenase [Aliibacillus thermotolerans]
MKKRVTEQLGIRYPIIEGGMAHVGDGRLAAAVTNAGGLGQVAVSGFSPERFREQLQIASTLTSGPLSVNVPLGKFFDYERYFPIIEEMKDHISAISLSSGDPRPHIPFLKNLGLTVMVVVASVKHAIHAEEGGADMIVCEGVEAGGRNSPQELTLFSLLPAITANTSLPVIAAGGITNGKAMFGAFSLGAEGIQVGTRFIATKESPAHPFYKRALVEASDEDTTIIERSIGGVNRVLLNDFVKKIQTAEKRNASDIELFNYINGQRNRIAAIDGKMDDGWVHSGQGIHFITEIASVDQVIRKYMEDFHKAYEEVKQKMNTVSIL